jgi:hypothetical protein
MTQKQRVMAALEKAGAAGISPEDFLLPNVIDGGKPILRLPARINDLRNDGLSIDTEHTRTTAIYTLRGSVEAASSTRVERVSWETSRLVDDAASSESLWDEDELIVEDLVWV